MVSTKFDSQFSLFARPNYARRKLRLEFHWNQYNLDFILIQIIPKAICGSLVKYTKEDSQTSWISLLWSVAVIYINLLISITCHPDLPSEISFIFSLYLGQISSGSNKKGFLRRTPGNGPHNSKITISSWRPEKMLWKRATRRWSSSTRVIKHDCYALPVSKRAFWRIFWAKGQRYSTLAKPLLELGQP